MADDFGWTSTPGAANSDSEDKDKAQREAEREREAAKVVEQNKEALASREEAEKKDAPPPAPAPESQPRAEQTEPVKGQSNASFAGQTKTWDDLSASMQAKYPEFKELCPEGVKFSAAGFPDFTPFAIAEVRFTQWAPDDRTKDVGAMWDAFGLSKEQGELYRDAGYMIHHNENRQTLQLIPIAVHEPVRHWGGIATEERNLTVVPAHEMELRDGIARIIAQDPNNITPQEQQEAQVLLDQYQERMAQELQTNLPANTLGSSNEHVKEVGNSLYYQLEHGIITERFTQIFKEHQENKAYEEQAHQQALARGASEENAQRSAQERTQLMIEQRAVDAEQAKLTAPDKRETFEAVMQKQEDLRDAKQAQEKAEALREGRSYKGPEPLREFEREAKIKCDVLDLRSKLDLEFKITTFHYSPRDAEHYRKEREEYVKRTREEEQRNATRRQYEKDHHIEPPPPPSPRRSHSP